MAGFIQLNELLEEETRVKLKEMELKDTAKELADIDCGKIPSLPHNSISFYSF